MAYTVTFDSIPRDARVYLNGILKGKTRVTLSNIEGRPKVIYKKTGYEDYNIGTIDSSFDRSTIVKRLKEEEEPPEEPPAPPLEIPEQKGALYVPVRYLGAGEHALLHFTSEPTGASWVNIDTQGRRWKTGTGKTPESMVYNEGVFGWPAVFEFSKAGYETLKFDIPEQDLAGWEMNIGVKLDPIEEEPPAPPEPLAPPEYPKTISREAYSFDVANKEQETYLRDFLGLEPPGVTIDEYLSKLDREENRKWWNYWHDVWIRLGRTDLMEFAGEKADEYAAKLPEEPENPKWWQDLPIVSSFLEKASHSKINAALTTLLKLPKGEELIEKLGMYGLDKLIKEAPEYEVLRKSPKCSLSVGIIIGLATLILGIGTVVGWLRKEAPEPAGMAVWAMIEAEEWEEARTANDQYLTFITKMNTWLPTVFSWFNPFLATFLNTNRDSQLIQQKAYKEMIDAKLELGRALVKITATPADAEIAISGIEFVKNPFEREIPIGPYDWSVTRFGYIPQSGHFDLTAAGEEFTVDLVKEEVPPEELEEELTISVTPDETEIFISGHPEITKEGTYTLPLGPYTIHFSLDGYKPATKYATLKTGKPITVSHVMLKEEEPEPEKAEVLITSKPSGARVIIDSKATFQETPYTHFFEEGPHLLRIELDGWEPEERDIEVSWGEKTTEDFLLKETPPTKGSFKIISDPPGASVYIDGESRFATTPYTITELANTYDLRLTRDGYLPLETEITVEAGIVKEKTFELDKKPITDARITFTSEPSDADIYIDGEYQYVTTPFTKLFKPTVYTIRVQKDGYYPETAYLEFEEGEETTVPFVLTEIPAPEIPSEPYIPQIPYYPSYIPAEPYVPSVITTPPPEIPPYDYSLLYPEIIPEYPIEPISPPVEKELMINIETTDLMPTKGRIYSIAILDLTTPDAETQIMVSNDEQDLIRAFLEWFEGQGFIKLVGYNVSFDYRYIFTKMMKYRIPSKSFKEIELRDVMQIMKQVKEEFVFGFNKSGTLDEWGKMLLGKGKYGSQELMLRKYIAGDFDYVRAFQNRQIELTKGLYDLARFCSSEGFKTLPSPISEATSPLESPQITESPKIEGNKICSNCKAYNPLSASVCEICGASI